MVEQHKLPSGDYGQLIAVCTAGIMYEEGTGCECVIKVGHPAGDDVMTLTPPGRGWVGDLSACEHPATHHIAVCDSWRRSLAVFSQNGEYTAFLPHSTYVYTHLTDYMPAHTSQFIHSTLPNFFF